MPKKILLLFSLLFLLPGCIGRVVVYPPEPAAKISLPEKQALVIKPSEPIVPPVSDVASYQSFIKKHNKFLDASTIEIISANILKYSQQFGIEPKYLFALIARESSFRASVVSSSGAIGMGQLLPATAKDMGISNPYDPEENIKATARFFSILLKKWNGSVELALASYKMGAYGVEKLLKAGNDLPEDTKKYISDIKSYYQQI